MRLWRLALAMLRWRSAISGKQLRSIYRTTWGTRLAAFMSELSAHFGRPRCLALLACASPTRGLSIAQTYRQAGAACRCDFSGGADGAKSCFRKAAQRELDNRRMIHERCGHP